LSIVTTVCGVQIDKFESGWFLSILTSMGGAEIDKNGRGRTAG
jgi:hypothetical protein